MAVPKYQWYRNAPRDFRWRLKSANGKTVASGEGYVTKAGALNGIEAHRRASARALVVEVKD